MTNLPVYLPAMPEIFLSVSILLILVIGAFYKGKRVFHVTTVLSIISLITTAGIVLWHTPLGDAFYGQFRMDDFAVFAKVLTIVASVICLLAGVHYQVERKMTAFEYPILISLAVLGMMVMISANSLLTLYMGLELQSLSLYVLAAFRRDTAKSAEAGLKYFVLGALASGLLLYGCSLIYGFTGTLDFAVIKNILSFKIGTSPAVVFGLVFVMAGLLFKLSAVPFHMWTPDVYEGAPTPVTLFFATAPKVAGFALLLRVLYQPFHHIILEWEQVIVFVSAISMLLGALAGIAQTKIKRLIAYSSIGHVGYALMGLIIGTADGVAAVLLYVFIYVIANIGFFSCLLYLRRDNMILENISDFAGLKKSHPVVAFFILILMLSMAGIPPLAGFISKLIIFKCIIDAGFFKLAIIGVVSSVIAAFYYLRIIKIMYFDEGNDDVVSVRSSSLQLVMFCTVFLIGTLVVYIQPVLEWAAVAGKSLL